MKFEMNLCKSIYWQGDGLHVHLLAESARRTSNVKIKWSKTLLCACHSQYFCMLQLFSELSRNSRWIRHSEQLIISVHVAHQFPYDARHEDQGLRKPAVTMRTNPTNSHLVSSFHDISGDVHGSVSQAMQTTGYSIVHMEGQNLT
jgi:hypothetical protein